VFGRPLRTVTVSYCVMLLYMDLVCLSILLPYFANKRVNIAIDVQLITYITTY